MRSDFESGARNERSVGKITLIFDGGSRGNPGPSAFCYILMDDGGILCIHSEYIGIATNNLSEYVGFLNGLRYLVNFVDPSKSVLKIKTDSELIVKQMKGDYSIRNPKLKELADEIKFILSRFKDFDLSHIPRSENLADEFVRRILESRKKGRDVEDNS